MDSIRNYISGIKTLHHILEVEFPSEDSHPLKLMLKGLARCKPHLPHRALPITPQILLDMHQFLDVLAPAGATFWYVFLFMFFLIQFSVTRKIVTSKQIMILITNVIYSANFTFLLI